MSSGDHHHFVYIRGESEVEVHLPIAPQKEQGEINVVIELNTQIMSSEQTVTINILPEGSIVHRHTSALLDLKSRANVLRFMNIIVDETPIIPYEVKMNIPNIFRGRSLTKLTNFYLLLTTYLAPPGPRLALAKKFFYICYKGENAYCWHFKYHLPRLVNVPV